jgi:hypothetical protein
MFGQLLFIQGKFGIQYEGIRILEDLYLFKERLTRKGDKVYRALVKDVDQK